MLAVGDLHALAVIVVAGPLSRNVVGSVVLDHLVG